MAVVDSLEVIIETKAQDTAKSLNNLVKQLGLIAEGISSIGSNTGLNEFAKKAQEATKNFSNIQNTIKGLSGSITPEMQKVSKSFDEIAAKYKDLGKSFTFVDLSALDQEELDNWFKNLPTIAQQAAQSVNSSFEQIQAPKIEGIDSKSLNYNANAIKAVFGETATEIQNYTEAITKLGQQAGTILNQPIKTDLSQMSTKELDEWFNNLPSIKAEAEKAARDINNSLKQVEKPRIVNISTKDLEYNADAIKEIYGKTSNEIQEFGEKLKRLEIPPIRENNLKKLRSSLTKTEAKLEELRSKLANGLEIGKITENLDDKGYQNLQEQIALTEKQVDSLKEKIKNTGTFERLSQSMPDIAKKGKQVSKIFNSLSATLKKLERGLKSVFSKITNLAKSMFSLGKTTQSSNSGFNFGLKTILKYGFGIRSLYVLINKLRGAVKDGMGNLVLYSDRTNQSVSMLKSSLNQLKNTAAAAFAPVLNAIAPALNALIQLCIRATNAINQFLSALTGNGTWIKAKYTYDDVAESIGGVAKAAKGAIRPFDELNNISLPDASGGGAGGINAGDMFETLPVENKFQKLADKIKSIASQLFEPLKQAWDSQGANVMKSWKYALEEIGLLAKSIGSDFLEVWQQPETLSMLENILVIISDIGLIVGHLAKNFREAWEANDTGLHILENIRDIFAVIVANIRHAADTTVDWAENLNFAPLLEAFERLTESLVPVIDSLSGILTDFYEQVLLPLGKWTIETGIPELLDVFTDFNEAVDWSALRNNLSTFWKHLEPFAETVGEGLIIFIERVSDLVADFLNSETFINFLHDLEDWMDSVTPEDIADGIEKLAKAFIAFKIAAVGLSALSAILAPLGRLATIFALFSGGGAAASGAITIEAIGADVAVTTETIGVATGIALGPVVAFVATIVALTAGLKSAYDANEEVRQSFDNAVNSIKEGFQPAIEFVTDTLLPDLNSGWDRLMEILSPLSNFLSGMFTSIWQDMINPALTYIGETVLPKLNEAFSNLWNNVLVPLGTYIADVLAPVMQIISDILNILWQNVVVPLAGAVGNILGPAFEGLVEIFGYVTERIQPIIEVVKLLWNTAFAPLINDLWNNFKPIFENVFKIIGGIIDEFGEVLGGLIDFVTGVFTGNWEKAWEGVKEIFNGIFNGLASTVEGVINTIIGMLNFFLGKFNGVVTSLGEVIGIDISIPEIPKVHLPKLANGAVFRGGNPYLAIVNDQKRGQTNVETPLKVIQEALREELQNFSVNFKATVPKMPNYRYEPALVPSYVGAYGNYQYNANPYASNGFNDGDAGILGMSETELYNLFYNATASALNNNKLLNDQKDMVKGILKKPTIEISDVHKAIVNDSMDRGGRIRGGNMMRLAVAEEMYR